MRRPKKNERIINGIFNERVVVHYRSTIFLEEYENEKKKKRFLQI
jgi:hypothetical protein